MSVWCRLCCKSRFAEGVQNFEGRKRVFRVDTKNRAVCDHTIMTIVRATGRDDDHFAFRLAQAGILQHQCVVVREKGAKLIGPVRQRQENIRHESCFRLDLQDLVADILRQIADIGDGVTTDGRGIHDIQELGSGNADYRDSLDKTSFGGAKDAEEVVTASTRLRHATLLVLVYNRLINHIESNENGFN